MAEFTCKMCGGTFEDGWTDEEANAEAEERWGVKNASENPDMSVVCDDCYAKLSEYMPPEVTERSKRLMIAKTAGFDSPVDGRSMISKGDLRYPFWPIGLFLEGEETERIAMDWIDGVITLQPFLEASEMFSVMKAQEFAGRLLYDDDMQEDYNTQCVDLRDGLILEGDVEFVEDRSKVLITTHRGVINNYATTPISFPEDELPKDELPKDELPEDVMEALKKLAKEKADAYIAAILAALPDEMLKPEYRTGTGGKRIEGKQIIDIDTEDGPIHVEISNDTPPSPNG